MPLILRAIISGFGYKIGAELGRLVAEKIGLRKPDNKRSEEEAAKDEDEFPAGLPKDPPEREDPPEAAAQQTGESDESERAA